MEPTGDFWSGVGEGVARADGWMVVAAITLIVLVIGALIVVAKYIYPGHKELLETRERNARELKERELDIREREADNDRERIKTNAALAENMRGLKESNDSIVREFAAQNAGIEESKSRSRAMGEDVSHVRRTTDHTAEQVDEIHQYIFREGTD